MADCCNLRFDDTNPIKEEDEYVESIQHDVRWLGFDWEDRLYYASDYFEQLYQWAVQADPRRQGLRLRLWTPSKRASTAARLTEPGQEQPFPRPRRSRRTLTCLSACVRANSATANGRCAQRSIWRRRT